MASNPITRFQGKYMSLGDMLGEWFYGFIMVAVVCGLLGGFSEVLLNNNMGFGRTYLTVMLVFVTFAVNISWGLIDGITVIYGGLTDKADLAKIISGLRKDRNNKELRDKLLDSVEGSSVEYLPDAEKDKIADRIIDEAPEAPKKYYLTREDRNTILAITSCDTLAVIPVIIPYLLLGFGKVPLLLSRLIAAICIGYIVFLYAGHIGRNKWLAAGIFVVLTVVMMEITYTLGWSPGLLDGQAPFFFITGRTVQGPPVFMGRYVLSVCLFAFTSRNRRQGSARNFQTSTCFTPSGPQKGCWNANMRLVFLAGSNLFLTINFLEENLG